MDYRYKTCMYFNRKFVGIITATHACTIVLVLSCSVALVHTSTEAIVHAYVTSIAHTCGHRCTPVMVHSCTKLCYMHVLALKNAWTAALIHAHILPTILEAQRCRENAGGGE